MKRNETTIADTVGCNLISFHKQFLFIISGARRPDESNVFFFTDKLTSCQGVNLLTIDRGLIAEIKLLNRFMLLELGLKKPVLIGTVCPVDYFILDDQLEKFQVGELVFDRFFNAQLQ